MKNHIGSVSPAGNLSHTFTNVNSPNNIVILNNHSWIKNKQILVVGEGLWPLMNSWGPGGTPDEPGNSLFFSQDTVAADSVMRDYLVENGLPTYNDNSTIYLQQAAVDGLGVYETSCTSGDQCSYAYQQIQLTKCDPDCSGTVPTPTPEPNPLCRADVDSSGQVESNDLSLILADYGLFDPQYDLNYDDLINGLDLALVIAGWGADCSR
jgi:hypothetical protein